MDSLLVTLQWVYHALRMLAIYSSIAIAGASMSQSKVVMPTITDKNLSLALSTQLNSIMLHHAHWFYLPLNSASLITNALVAMLSLASNTWQNPTRLLSLYALRVLAPAALCVITTAYTVRYILPINEQIHKLAEQTPTGADSKEAVQQERSKQQPEIRQAQHHWRKLNMTRCVLLLATAMATISSPAMTSFYNAMA